MNLSTPAPPAPAAVSTIDPATLITIVDTVFDVLETATSSRPIVHGILVGVHALAEALLPSILQRLSTKGVKVG